MYGYRGKDTRGNLFALPTGEIVYYVASLAVLYSPESQVTYSLYLFPFSKYIFMLQKIFRRNATTAATRTISSVWRCTRSWRCVPRARGQGTTRTPPTYRSAEQQR